MKINIIEGRKGCKELEIDLLSIDGLSKNKVFRTLYMNKRKYRLTLKSYKQLIETLRKRQLYNKLTV